MLEKLATYWQFGGRFGAIEHTASNAGDLRILGTLLKQRKKELLLEQTFEMSSIEAVSEALPKHQNTVLVLNNDKVLQKRVESEQTDALKLVYKCFPNIKINDFYYQVFTQQHVHFVAICRKDDLDDLVATYTKAGISIIKVCLGQLSVAPIVPFVDLETLHTSNGSISIASGRVLEISKTASENRTYGINGVEVNSTGVLSFSAALQTALGGTALRSNRDEVDDELFQSYKHQRFFKQFLKIGGLSVLLLLLGNFFVFNHYFNEVEALKQVSQINTANKTKIVALTDVVSEKQKTVEDLLKSNGSRASFYANAIVQTMPKSVVLTQFNYQPLLKRIRENKPVELDNGVLLVSGVSGDSAALSKWVQGIDEMDWVEEVAIADYGFASRGKSDFELKIKVSYDW